MDDPKEVFKKLSVSNRDKIAEYICHLLKIQDSKKTVILPAKKKRGG